MEIAIENVATTEVNGPVTSGKGTALTVKKGISTQIARKAFNTEKSIVHIIKLEEKKDNNLVLGAI